MDFSLLFNDLKSVFQFMLSEFKLFFHKINSYQIIIFSLIILVSFPSFILIFDFISSISKSSDDVVDNMYSRHKAFLFKRKNIDSRVFREKFNSVKHFKKYEKANIMAQEFFKEHPNRFRVKIDGFSFRNKRFKINNKYSTYSFGFNSKSSKKDDDE